MAEAHHAIIQGQKLAATEQDTQGEPWELRTDYRLYLCLYLYLYPYVSIDLYLHVDLYLYVCIERCISI